jgi:hypothetical protein
MTSVPTLAELKTAPGKVRDRVVRITLLVKAPWAAFAQWAWANGTLRRILVVSVTFMMLVFGISVITVVQQPLTVANSVVQRMFGDNGDGLDGGKGPAPDVCQPPPRQARPEVMPPVATTVTLTPTSGSPTAVPTVVRGTEPPPPVLDANDMPTPEALRMIKEIPKAADVYAAQTYLLYRAAHPRGDFPRDWQDWIDSYYAARSTLSTQATPLEVAGTLDSTADYRPYVLFSLSATYRLARDGQLSADKRQMSTILQQLNLVCQKGVS